MIEQITISRKDKDIILKSTTLVNIFVGDCEITKMILRESIPTIDTSFSYYSEFCHNVYHKDVGTYCFDIIKYTIDNKKQLFVDTQSKEVIEKLVQIIDTYFFYAEDLISLWRLEKESGNMIYYSSKRLHNAIENSIEFR